MPLTVQSGRMTTLPGPLVEPEWLAQHLDASDVRVLEATAWLDPPTTEGKPYDIRSGRADWEAPAMHARLIRLDAMVFRADSVRFEACATYRGADDDLCECGWLEADHAAPITRRQFAGRRPRRRPATIAARETA